MKNKIMTGITVVVVLVFMMSLIAGYKQLYEEEIYEKTDCILTEGCRISEGI